MVNYDPHEEYYDTNKLLWFCSPSFSSLSLFNTPFMVATLGLIMYCVELRKCRERLCNLWYLSLQGLPLWRTKLQEKVSFFYSLQSDTKCVCVEYYIASHAADTPTVGHLHHFIGQSGKEIKIIEQVSHRWQSVAYAMGFDAAVVETIQQDVFFQCTPACEKVFHRWLTATNDAQTSRTWEIIVVKLRECGFSVLAANVDFELL